MSWIQKLYETYERCVDAPQFRNAPLMPVGHTEQQAHVEIVLDGQGNFLRAAVVPKEATVVPATEESAGRTGKRPPPHPLCDKIQYCAADYRAFGGAKVAFFNEYRGQLQRWCGSDANPKLKAVMRYVEKGEVVADLVGARVLHCDSQKRLLTEWTERTPAPEIFKLLPTKDGKRDQGDAFVRWRVEVPGDPISAVWEDPQVRQSWIRFEATRQENRGLCMVTGATAVLAESHPKRLRHGADGAKLISSNDGSGFTFRGRFDLATQAYGVGSEVTQKAHSALRWLIARQGYHDKASGQVFVAWSVRGADVPDPFKDTGQLFDAAPPKAPEADGGYTGDAGQAFGLRLRSLIDGYRSELGDAEEVVILGLDSATPGRMAITYYRELTGSEFLDRLYGWHAHFAWSQNFGKNRRFIGAPAPRDIAEGAYGSSMGEKVRKAMVERLFPCIVDGRPVPRDMVAAVENRVLKRVGMEKWEWEKCLGIACALFRGSNHKEEYRMSLEADRATRDYLFGRLLAIAENTEQRALHLAGENRDTHAAKLMQRFADRPCSTWKTIELALAPARSRLRANRPSVLLERERLLDEVTGMFRTEDFTSDRQLSGEFLLGYHCQRAALWRKAGQDDGPEAGDENQSQGENA